MIAVAFHANNKPVGQVIACNREMVVAATPNGEIVEVLNPRIGVYKLPIGMSFASWVEQDFRYRVLTSAGFDHQHPATWWASLAMTSTPPHQLRALAQLVDYRGTSTFRTSLRDQVVKWLSTAALDRSFSHPLSKKQVDALLGDASVVARHKDCVDALLKGGDLMSLSVALQSKGPLRNALVGSTQAPEEGVLHGP